MTQCSGYCRCCSNSELPPAEDPVPAEEATDGEKLVSLLVGSQSWVHRRVDALRLGGDGATRLQVSFEVTVPADLRLARPGNKMAVPLAFMAKKPLRKLHTSDPSGKPASILDTPVNGDYAHQFLLALAPGRVQSDTVAWPAVREALRDIVASDGGASAAAPWRVLQTLLSRSADRNGPLTQEDEFEQSFFLGIARQMGEQFLFLMEIDAALVGTRVLLKYSLDQDAPRTDTDPTKRAIFSLVIPDFGFAASQHVEVELPQGVILERITLEERLLGDAVQRSLATDVPDRRTQRLVGHVALRPSARFASGELFVTAIPAKQGLYRFAKISILAVSLVVLAAWFVRLDVTAFIRRVDIPSPSASILLIGPALLLSWFSRATEHSLIAKIQGPLRLGLLASATVLLGFAVLAAVPVTPVVWAGAWLVLTAVQCSALLLLAYYASDFGRWIKRIKWRLKANP